MVRFDPIMNHNTHLLGPDLTNLSQTRIFLSNLIRIMAAKGYPKDDKLMIVSLEYYEKLRTLSQDVFLAHDAFMEEITLEKTKEEFKLYWKFD